MLVVSIEEYQEEMEEKKNKPWIGGAWQAIWGGVNQPLSELTSPVAC